MTGRMRRLWARLRAPLDARRADRDFEQELESHLAMSTDDLVRRGMPPDAARRLAAIRVGGRGLLAEQHRDARGLAFVDATLQDLRLALRQIGRARGVALAAIAALALGIGANTVGFTIVHAALLRALPFEDPARVVILSWQHRSGRRINLSQAELQAVLSGSRSFSALAAYREGEFNLSDDRALPQPARGTWLTPNAFAVLGLRPRLGRGFSADDARPGAAPVAVIASRLWRSRYGGDPGVLGRPLRLNGQPATIVGVMPEGVAFPDDSLVWVPLVPPAGGEAEHARALRVFGRLRDGADRRAAHAELDGLAGQLRASYPDRMSELVGVRVESFTDRFIGGAGRPMFLTVMGAVVLVLLIACANVATLLLSRSAARAREIAVRKALGATRLRIVRQLLVESLVLGFAGGGLGLLLASGGLALFDAAMRESLPYWVVFTLDYTVFAYVAGVCVLTALLSGLAPALHVSKTSHGEVLKDGARAVVGSRRDRRLGGVLVVAELALTIVLLMGAGSMVRSALALSAIDLGFEADGLMAMEVRLPASTYPTPEARRAFFAVLEPRVAATPGVGAVALTTGVPPLDGGERLLDVDRGAAGSDARPVHVGTVTITPRFFDALGVPLVRGRGFSDRDGAPGLETVIVNERLAAQFFPGEDPIGRRLRFVPRTPAGGAPDAWRTIVGVSGRILQGSPTDAYENAVVYIPYRQEAPAGASLLLRSALQPAAVMDAVRRAVQAIDRDQPVFDLRTLAQVSADDRWWPRTWGSLFGSLALIGLVLSSVGLYAVVAHAASERTREIGLRVALGARRGQVVWLVIRQGLARLALGLTLGLGASWALRPVLPTGMAGVTAHDPAAMTGVAALLAIVCLAACLLPARRAARLDPVVALRKE
jgi:predicted permease